MKVFTTVEISKEDLDKTIEAARAAGARAHKMLELFLDLVEDEILVQMKFTNMPPRPYPGFRPASEI